MFRKTFQLCLSAFLCLIVLACERNTPPQHFVQEEDAHEKQMIQLKEEAKALIDGLTADQTKALKDQEVDIENIDTLILTKEMIEKIRAVSEEKETAVEPKEETMIFENSEGLQNQYKTGESIHFKLPEIKKGVPRKEESENIISDAGKTENLFSKWLKASIFKEEEITPPAPKTEEVLSPQTKEACQLDGGSWIRGQDVHQTFICVKGHNDAGRECADSSECAGKCLADNPEDTSGRCQRNDNPIGCFQEVKQGKVQEEMCIRELL